MATITDAIIQTPTLLQNTLLRGSEGQFGAPRTGGKTHQGIDIVAIVSSPDKSTYQVRATAPGVVAYAQNNGTAANPGYGYTIVIDHQNGFYTLYAHLAPNASSGIVVLGQPVNAGDLLGYLADLANGEKSSGNARAVAPYDRIQLHFECFETDPGRSSSGQLLPIKANCTLDDPTNQLLALGYGSF
jgi:murein DD-endopeptidase MepM/ murein hydrolase activator NlpD